MLKVYVKRIILQGFRAFLCRPLPAVGFSLRASAIAIHVAVWFGKDHRGILWRPSTRFNRLPMALFDSDLWELLSFIVTVIGLPGAIFVFLYEQRKERENEEEAVYQLLSDNYQDFLKVALEHPDLRLFSARGASALNADQAEQRYIIFQMLISLFERAYLLLYEPKMSPKQARRWNSWDDYIREWCVRPDFHTSLPSLLSGEDPDFVRYVEALSSELASERAKLFAQPLQTT
jgi:hypothetical protein